ncbi:MAG: DEAD/DEAH box helicase [Magnetococcus sp. DMHC-1]
MTTLPLSASEAFHKLHAGVQKWIWKQGWQQLHPIQVDAIQAILDTSQDVIISAATAGGKTEAAFLPILSRLASTRQEPGFQALYLSPLKALINDQYRRLGELCQETEIPVVRWHGDVGQAAKQKARKTPQGLLLITPESLEALFVRRGQEMGRLFASLKYVVIDELHAFIGTERGMQLQSLLARMEMTLEYRVPRIGLSATLGELFLAAEVLRPDEGKRVILVESKEDGKELRIQLRGILRRGDAEGCDAEGIIANHLHAKLRGSHNLVFAGSRRRVEVLSDILRTQCMKINVPNEFFPHHGNLSKDIREEVELRLRDGELPTTAVCTTTLELGIDIGAVKSVAQIGPPCSVAGLRQRLGRSGRRREPATMRLYVIEEHLESHSNLLDTLRPDLVQAVAAIRLLLDKWCEPPRTGSLHLSTLVHQILAVIAQKGGILPTKLHELLCGTGPFRKVDSRLMARVLRSMANKKLLEQSPEGVLMLGEVGEAIVDHYLFYSVFQTPEEFRVMAHGRQIGRLPVNNPLVVGEFLIFSGKRWVVIDIDLSAKVIKLREAPAGKPPCFDAGREAPLHDRLVTEMRQVYLEGSCPNYLDGMARTLLAEGFAAWQRLGLAHRSWLPSGNSTTLFPWVGSQRCLTLQLALQLEGVACSMHSPFIEVEMPEDKLLPVLARMAASPPPDPFLLAEKVPAKRSEKFHPFLSDDLLAMDWVSSTLETSFLPALIRKLLGHPTSS